MTADEFLDKQFHLSVAAGMNQRYHQDRELHWSIFDRGSKIAVGLLAAACAFLTGITFAKPSTNWDYASLIAAVFAGIAGIILNVLPFGEWVNRHTALFQRWTDYREDVDSLLFDLTEEPTPGLVERLKQLDAKLHRICGAEPAPIKAKLRACYDDEYASRKSPELACNI